MRHRELPGCGECGLQGRVSPMGGAAAGWRLNCPPTRFNPSEAAVSFRWAKLGKSKSSFQDSTSAPRFVKAIAARGASLACWYALDGISIGTDRLPPYPRLVPPYPILFLCGSPSAMQGQLGKGSLTDSRARLSTKSPYSSLSGSEGPSRVLNFEVLNGRCLMNKYTMKTRRNRTSRI